MDVELADIQTQPEKRTTTSGQRNFSRDEAVLARFGKRQQLRVSVLPHCHGPSLILLYQRGFSLLPAIGLTSTLMITWEVITSSVLAAQIRATDPKLRAAVIEPY